MSGCGEGAEWVEQLRTPRQGHCTSQSQPVKATLLRRAVTLCATVARWLRRQNGLIWYYLVHDNFFMSGLDWGTIIIIAFLFTNTLQDFYDGYYVDDVTVYDTLPSEAELEPLPIAEY